MSRADETSFGRTVNGQNIEFLLSDEGYEALLAELNNPLWREEDTVEDSDLFIYYLTKVVEKIREMLGDEEE